MIYRLSYISLYLVNLMQLYYNCAFNLECILRCGPYKAMKESYWTYIPICLILLVRSTLVFRNSQLV